MRRLIIFMHTSIDGFVAGLNGEMDWIHVDEEMFDYAGRLTEEADIALYGRVTYQMMEAYWPTAADQPNATKHDIDHSRWYNKVEKVVMSRTIASSGNNMTVIGENAAGEIRKLKEKDGKNMLMFGSPGAAQSLMQEDLIDDYWLFINPVILGKGIPMFQGLENKISLRLSASNVFSSGVMGLHYERISDSKAAGS